MPFSAWSATGPLFEEEEPAQPLEKDDAARLARETKLRQMAVIKSARQQDFSDDQDAA